MNWLWVLTILLALGLGVMVGLYLSTKSVGEARHRKPVDPRPVLMPPTSNKDMATKNYVDMMGSWKVDQEELDDYRESFKDKLDEADPERLQRVRDHVDKNSTVEEMEKGHWEGLSGSLEPEEPRVALRPEETSSSLLGLSGGTIKPTASIKPVFGETERLTYDPDDYEEPLICQPCKRALVKGETFWAVSLPEEGEGVFIPICDDCEAKSHG